MPAAGLVQLLQTIQGAMCSGRRVNHTLTKLPERNLPQLLLCAL